VEQKLPKVASSNKYQVCFAETTEEVWAAQSLRYQVFNVELGEGLAGSHETGRDTDKYDMQCDHLLVIDRKTDKIIGTYRMQTYQTAIANSGFYTGNEFDLSALPENILSQSVEVGRACIAKEHRNGRVLYLLWRGIAEYLKTTNNRYLFGCCSLTSTDPKQGWEVMDYLEKKNFLHDKYRLKTTPEFCCKEQDRVKDAWKQVKLPQLFRLYLDLNAQAVSEPALDSNFKTIDFLIVVDIEKLDERSKTLFFK